MAYDESVAQRIREILIALDPAFQEKKMFGFLCFMVYGKLCCGTRTDKKTGEHFLLCRVSPEVFEREIEKDECEPLVFKNKSMTRLLLVRPEGYASARQLKAWINLSLKTRS